MKKIATSFLVGAVFCAAVSFVSVSGASDAFAAEPADSNAAPNADSASTAAPVPPTLGRGADPWIIEFEGRYYRSASDNRRGEIVLWVADSPDERGERRAIWKAPKSGPFSRELWAPEIYFLDGRFYVFFAASNGENRNHRTYVLVSEGADPLGKYRLEGPLYTGDDALADGEKFDPATNRWAIDATIFERGEKRYIIWSGWEDDRDVQYLYIAPFALNPPRTTGPRIKICDNADFLWERVEERLGTRGLNEGPEILTTRVAETPKTPENADSPKTERTFLTYSCGASWLPTYKVALLELVGDDPLDPKSWRKHPEPFLQSDAALFGVGHGAFLRDANGVLRYYFHSKRDRAAGWDDREIFWRPVEIDETGFPRVVSERRTAETR